MGNVLRAEWQKMTGNRWTIGLLIWVFPIGAFSLIASLSLMALLSTTARDNLYLQLWTEAFMMPWSFINNMFGQMFLLGFTAVTFAGEYQWGTWKNILPRQRRSQLIIAKFINIGVLILITFTLTSLIFGFGYGILSYIAGEPYGPEVTSQIVREFLGDYALEATLAFVSITITSVYAALAAILMRSILGGVMVGIGISLVDPLLFTMSLWLSRVLGSAFFLHLARISPFYNIENIKSWVRNDQAVNWMETSFEMFHEKAPVDSMGFSMLALASLVLLGIGLVLFLFQRQDITT
ncbi:MAG: ABC transporter permease [Chloroflexi bacterium]|nr:ABC transporter permease [Chloroflexota bacterium]